MCDAVANNLSRLDKYDTEKSAFMFLVGYLFELLNFASRYAYTYGSAITNATYSLFIRSA